MNVSVDLNEVYEEKTAFYRKLDNLCVNIHDFKQQQESLFNPKNPQKHYSKPDMMNLKVQCDPDYLNQIKKAMPDERAQQLKLILQHVDSLRLKSEFHMRPQYMQTTQKYSEAVTDCIESNRLKPKEVF